MTGSTASILPIDSGELRALVIGASGGIGGALANTLERSGWAVDRLARTNPDERPALDITNEGSVAAAAALLAPNATFALIIVATGLLQDDEVRPEKTFRDLSSDALTRYFAVNAIGPAIVAKHFLPLLPTATRSVFAVLSARVGSTSDNRLGGWYGYRASKAALNSLVRTLAVELARTRPHAICVALHPGTVDTRLSKPFQTSVPPGSLFSPEHAAEHLVQVIDQLTPSESGRCYAWNGAEIDP